MSRLRSACHSPGTAFQGLTFVWGNQPQLGEESPSKGKPSAGSLGVQGGRELGWTQL